MEDQDKSKPAGDLHNRHYTNIIHEDYFTIEDFIHRNKPLVPKKSLTHDILTDLEAQSIRLKHSLESWREIVLPVNSVLLWEKSWYPAAIVGGTTFLFLSVWLLDPSVLTTVSIIGLTLTISDYIVPILAAAFFKPESWSPKKDSELYNFCRGIVVYKAKIALSFAAFCAMRSSRPKMYYSCTIATLAFLAWIGNTFNNLFLTYMLVTILLLVPGLEYHGILHKYGSMLTQKITELTKFKSAQPKKEQ